MRRLQNRVNQFFIYDNLRLLGHYLQIALWYLQKRPLPLPPRKKHQFLQKCARQFSTPVFVETGTYYGDTLNALKNNFKKLYSIELDEYLCHRAQKRFSRYSHINVFCGDSAQHLPPIIAQINQPTLFWLDAHYSGGITAKGSRASPILQELTQIFKEASFNYIILIDDARCFTESGDFPSLQELRTLVGSYTKAHNLSMTIHDDIIRIHSHA